MDNYNSHDSECIFERLFETDCIEDETIRDSLYDYMEDMVENGCLSIEEKNSILNEAQFADVDDLTDIIEDMLNTGLF